MRSVDVVIIKKLKLENYRRFRSLDLELPENLIGIIGSNGVGKTTLVEAMGWVLYGNKIRRSDKQDVKSQFSSNDDVCNVEMVFSIGGHEYRVIRKLRGKTAVTEAAIYRDGNLKPEAVQEKGVNDYIENLINLDYKSFFASVFARQRELAALSVLQPEERKRSIARLINIDQIDRARVQIRTDKNSKEDTKKGLEIRLQGEQELKNKKSELTGHFKLKRTEFDNLQKIYDDQLKDFDTIKSAYDKLDSLRDRFHDINSKLTTLNARLKDFEERNENYAKQLERLTKIEADSIPLKEEIKNFDDVKKSKERLDLESSRYAELQQFRSRDQQLSQIIDRKRVEIKKEYDKIVAMGDVDKKLSDVEQVLKDKERLLGENEKTLMNLIADLKNVEQKGLEVKEHRNNVLKLGTESPCPICTRPLGDHYDEVIGKFEHDIWDLRARFKEIKLMEDDCRIKSENLKKEIERVKIDRDTIIREHQAFKQRIEANEKLGLEIHGLVDEQQIIRTEMKKLGKVEYDQHEHVRLRNEFERLSRIRDSVLQYEENLKQKAHVESELGKSIAIISDLKRKISDHMTMSDELKYDEKVYLATKQRIEMSRLDIDKSRKGAEMMKQELIKIEKDIEKVNDEIDARKQLMKTVRTIDEEISYLNSLDYHFGVFRQELAGRIRPLISQRASDLLSLTTNGSYSLIDLDEDYNIYIFDQSEKFPINRFSGGEQDLANLCLRIAISQVVAERSGGKQVNFIVLDEIFGSQDEQRKELILKMLQHLSSQFRQVFVITHVEEIKDIMPVVISVQRKDRAESTVTLL